MGPPTDECQLVVTITSKFNLTARSRCAWNLAEQVYVVRGLTETIDANIGPPRGAAVLARAS